MRWGVAFALLTLPIGSCTSTTPGQTRPTVNVVSWSPEGAAHGHVDAVEVMFDHPVVEEAEVGRPLPAGVVRVEPAVEVTAHFRDRQTLVVQPAASLAPGTRYQVTLLDDLPATIPDDERQHSFVYEPIEVVGIRGVDTQWFPPEGPFELQLSLAVTASEVAGRCRFEAGRGHVELRAASPDEVSTNVSLRPASALARGQVHVLRCEGIVAHGGNEPLAAAFTRDVTPYPEAGVVSVTPGSGQVTPDELELVVETRTPVALDQIRRHVHLEPRLAGLSGRWMSRGPTTFYQTANLEAATRYRMVVTRGLTDEFGQTTVAPFEASFETTDASPRMHMETGIYAIEAEATGFPVWTRNVDRFEVKCAHVPPSRIPALLTTTMDYDPWYSDGEETIDWQEQRLRTASFDVPVPEARNRWRLHEIDLTRRCGGRGQRGVYLAEFRSEQVREARAGDYYFRYPYRLLGNVTNLGVLLKVGPSSGLVWVTALSTGSPVAGAQVTIYDGRGQRVHSGRTDADGLLRMPGSGELLRQAAGGREDFEDDSGYGYYGGFRSQRVIAVVQSGGDVAAVDGNWQNGIQIWNFGVPEDTRTGGQTTMRGFILSDRGIYRPGEEVHFKGFVREVGGGRAPRVPTARHALVHVEDPRGAELVRRRVELSAFGGFALDFEVSPEAALGDYYVRATIGEQTFREEFVVQEFRPVSFEITERGGRGDAPAIGERVTLRYNAGYLFGAPVANAPAQWQVQRRRRFIRFPEYPTYTWEDWSRLDGDAFWSRYETHESYVTDGEAHTDREGNLLVAFRDGGRGIEGAQDYLVQVSVTDPTDQRVSKRSVITVHPTDTYLGMHTQEYVQAVGMPFAVNLVAVSPEGTRLGTTARLGYHRRRRQCSGGDGPHGWRSCETVLEPVWEREVTLAAGGVTTERIEPEEAGEFLIRLDGTDRAGRPVAASSMVWILGEGEAFWSGDESARMSLIASKEQYDPGDTARLLPQADVAGSTVLVTTERSGILDARVSRLGSGVRGIEVPIGVEHAPNVFVSVAAVRGRRGPGHDEGPSFHMGVSNLEVSPDRQRLEIAIETEREEYRPGETVTGTVRVLSGGTPVRAELSLSVADEGVLQLVGYQTPDPIATFYRSWGLGVENATNWNRIARQRPPSGFEEEDGEDSGAGGEDGVRSRFVASAFWAPALVTDAAGRAAFSFEAPDNLTAFRLMAAAADDGARFGRGDRRIRIRKDLMATPILPRFFHRGDRVEIGVAVQNHTEAAGEAVVTLEVEGLSVSEREKRVRVAAGGTARVMFPATVARGGDEARVRVATAMGRHRDGFEHTLPIRRSIVIEPRVVAEGRLDGAPVTTTLSWADPTLPADSRLSVTVDPMGMAELEPSLRYLIEYPYGCLEQTLSQLIALFTVRDLATSLGLAEIRDAARLRAYTRHGIDRVLRHQHADGMFSLWPSTNTDPVVTAYAMWGLSLAEGAGTRVRPDAIRRGLEALSGWANQGRRSLSPGGEIATMAMVAHVLAASERPDRGLMARLFDARAALPSYGKALLLRAMAASGAPDEQIGALASDLVASAVIDGDRAVIRETGDLGAYFSSDVRSTAMTLSALLEARPGHPLVPKLVEGLKHARVHGGRWGTTQENLYGLVGLADYARARTGGDARVTVRLGGERIGHARLRGGEILHVERPLSRLSPGELVIESTEPVHYAARLVLARPPGPRDATGHGLDVRREVVDFESGEPVTEARVGQLLEVRVHVTPRETTRHVAVTSPIGAGFEIVNLALETEGAPASGTSSGRRGWWSWTHSQLRDQRAEAFADSLGAERTLEVLVRATRRGTFAVPGATAEAMYDPGVYGRTSATTITVR